MPILPHLAVAPVTWTHRRQIALRMMSLRLPACVSMRAGYATRIHSPHSLQGVRAQRPQCTLTRRILSPAFFGVRTAAARRPRSMQVVGSRHADSAPLGFGFPPCLWMAPSVCSGIPHSLFRARGSRTHTQIRAQSSGLVNMGPGQTTPNYPGCFGEGPRAYVSENDGACRRFAADASRTDTSNGYHG
jgi:hypothetical protein